MVKINVKDGHSTYKYKFKEAGCPLTKSWAPTRRQIDYIQSLAAKLGMDEIDIPENKKEASRLIDELKNRIEERKEQKSAPESPLTGEEVPFRRVRRGKYQPAEYEDAFEEMFEDYLR